MAYFQVSRICVHRFSCVSKLSPRSSCWQVRTELAGVMSPAKATDISYSYREQLRATKSSITHGNLAGSHAGWAPNSSVNTAQHFITKRDWLQFGGVSTPVHPLISKRILFLFTLYTLQSVRIVKISQAQRKLNALFAHVAEWSSWCLKLVDDRKHVGQFPPRGVCLTIKQRRSVCRDREGRRQDEELGGQRQQ